MGMLGVDVRKSHLSARHIFQVAAHARVDAHQKTS